MASSAILMALVDKIILNYYMSGAFHKHFTYLPHLHYFNNNMLQLLNITDRNL